MVDLSTRGYIGAFTGRSVFLATNISMHIRTQSTLIFCSVAFKWTWTYDMSPVNTLTVWIKLIDRKMKIFIIILFEVNANFMLFSSSVLYAVPTILVSCSWKFKQCNLCRKNIIAGMRDFLNERFGGEFIDLSLADLEKHIQGIVVCNKGWCEMLVLNLKFLEA